MVLHLAEIAHTITLAYLAYLIRWAVGGQATDSRRAAGGRVGTTACER